MLVQHSKSDTIADFTGVVTQFNSQGSTATVNATDLVRPSDWNSTHNFFATISGNTAGQSTASGTNMAYGATGGITASFSTAAGAATLWNSVANAYTGAWFLPELWGGSTTETHNNGTLYMRPFELDGFQDGNVAVFHQSMTQTRSTHSFSGSISAAGGSSGSASFGQTGTLLFFSRVQTNNTQASYNSVVTFDSHTHSWSVGYSASVSWSTNASSATVSVTTSGAVGFINHIDNAGGVTTTSTTQSGSTSFSSTSTAGQTFSSSFALTFPNAHLSGVRPLYCPMAGTVMTPGQYYVGLIQSTTQGDSGNIGLSRVINMQPAMYYLTSIGQNSFLEIGNSLNESTSNWRPGYGSFSSSGSTTTDFALSQVSIMQSNASLLFGIDGNTL